MSESPAGKSLAELMNEIAESLIVKHNLRNSHGEVVCWNCHGRPATMPSLHCVTCLERREKR